MTGQEVAEKLEALGLKTSTAGLEPMTILLDKLGHPEKKLKFVHLGGTNGKGSVSAMLYAIFNRCDYKAGLFTSPHLYSVHERIQVDGKNITDEALGELGEKVFSVAEEMVAEGMEHPSLFECSLAVALLYFKEMKTEVALIEAGKDGSLDPTNVIGVPVLTVITNIDYDWHKEHQGSLAEIVREKVSMIKAGTSVAVYHQAQEVLDVVSGICQELSVPIVISRAERIKLISQNPKGQKLSIDGKVTQLSLVGEHQRHNVALALDAVQLLKERGFGFEAEGIMAGFSRTVWPGRFERVHIAPDCILDGCHNVQSVAAVVKTLGEIYPEKSVIFLMGVLEQVDYLDMIDEVLPIAQKFVTVTPNHPHAMSGEALATCIQEKTSCPVVAAANVSSGVQMAMQLAGKEDVVCAFGSLHIVGDIRRMLGLC